MNRVRLRPTGVSGSEYINASFLDVSQFGTANCPIGHYACLFIVGLQAEEYVHGSAGPCASTVNDFWRMVWEFKSRAVVMLCQLEENGQVSASL